ncbi:MAG: hypothetical protein CVV33_03490 [Methanomicrobiales archaeon HGW-Methanomicrobiales-4]|nr:MAG: hypothetical protein CVV33_03490 [Methanomicrobiales archaeon HGW-Methanomicrobiales-4]
MYFCHILFSLLYFKQKQIKLLVVIPVSNPGDLSCVPGIPKTPDRKERNVGQGYRFFLQTSGDSP